MALKVQIVTAFGKAWFETGGECFTVSLLLLFRDASWPPGYEALTQALFYFIPAPFAQEIRAEGSRPCLRRFSLFLQLSLLSVILFATDRVQLSLCFRREGYLRTRRAAAKAKSG